MNKLRKPLSITTQLCSIMLLAGLIGGSARAQVPSARTNRDSAGRTRTVVPPYRLSLSPVSFRLMPSAAMRTSATAGSIAAGLTSMAPNLQVVGSGTIGRLTKWTGLTSSNSVIGDSSIFESKTGVIGIGTDTPTSRLTVVGMIETTLGGLKFPDGTIQTSAAVTGLLSIVHDQTLRGDGTSAQPLGLSVPLSLSGDVSNGDAVITVTNISAGGPAVFATGGNGGASIGGGSGVLALGGEGFNTSAGGVGLVGFGGPATGSSGGAGGSVIGGVSTNGSGGDGLFAVGALGTGAGKKGGRGIVAIPGGGAGGATAGLAGEFLGDVSVTGNLSKGGGSFKIDHPLDPENKYLYHSFVESPDMMNVYNGNVSTDENGEAVVRLPDYFNALNKDFRYQLTVIGTFAQAVVGEEIKDNRFTIKTNAAKVKVSWQVTGIRQDAYANRHRIPVEEQKLEQERGFYLHPEVFNQPEERSIQWSRSLEIMHQTKETHSKQIEESKKKPRSNDQ